MMRRLVTAAAVALLMAGPGAAGTAQSGIGETDGVHQFRLSNGLQVVVAVRSELQLAAVNTTVGLGAIDDPPGQFGIAHLLEHVTLQGSTTIGSVNPEAEAAALDELDRAHAELKGERRKGPRNSSGHADLEQRVARAQQAASKLAEEGEILGSRLEAAGAIGLNATTSTDVTQFFSWIPPENVEVWLALEAERLKHPVLRRFYSEREVVLREVTAMTGGRSTLAERFLQGMFPSTSGAHPLAGDLEQIAAIDRPAAFAYFNQFYRPDNIVIAIVGNVDPLQIRDLCERHFGDWRRDGREAGPQQARVQSTLTPPGITQHSFLTPRGVAIYYAFPSPGRDQDLSAAREALAATLNSEAVSPLYRRLMLQLGWATSLRAVPNYPSQKQQGFFLLEIRGRQGVTREEIEEQVASVLKTLDLVSDEDLQAGILAAEMKLASELEDVPTLASLLAFNLAANAHWRRPFERLEMLRLLKPGDLRQAAHGLFDGLASARTAAPGR